MRIPPRPLVGSLIAYAYLWLSQKQTFEDGRKTYPCAVVLRRDDVGPDPVVYLLGISHSPPQGERRAIEVPLKLKRHLGLDAERSWIYTDELNVFIWPGADLRLARHLSRRPDLGDSCVIGTLPTDWFQTVVEHVDESRRLGLLQAVKRTRF